MQTREHLRSIYRAIRHGIGRALERARHPRLEVRRLGEALPLLDPASREVFRLQRIQGLTRSQTAERLQLTEAEVDEFMITALVALSKRLRPER